MHTRFVDADTTGKEPVTGRSEYRVWLEEPAAPSEDEARLGRVAVPAPLFLITAKRRCYDHKPIDQTHPDPYGGTGRTGFAVASAAAF